ncbi:MAG: argininosuccinate synthase [Chloroflexi bacterium]|nr:argininosuccinate synthase [Chloroflexota bacterium]
MKDKELVILAYSGGLDTSVAIPWLKENYNAEVITVTADLGQDSVDKNLEEKALKSGALRSYIIDGRETFINEFVWPSLRASAIYEGQYPLATALGRPLIARYLVEIALKEGGTAIAHGCTGKGNDQVRLDVGVSTLAPQLSIIAPAREWNMDREQEIEYGEKRGLELPVTRKNLYSVDENIWGRSIESGPLEDPWNEPPEEIYSWTRSISDAPQDPMYIEIDFDKGLPVALDGKSLSGIDLVKKLNFLAGSNGVGRIDHLENRLVGIKSREIYESPAAIVLHACHNALETMTLVKEQQRFKNFVSQQYADMIYNGLWYSSHRRNLDAYISSTQEFVTGKIRVKLFKGSCSVVGRSSPYALYDYELATYDESDKFDHSSAEGFIKLFGLPYKTQTIKQD